MSLQNFCRKSLVKVSPDTNITKACRLMAKNNVGCLVAEKDGELCGIITDRDIAGDWRTERSAGNIGQRRYDAGSNSYFRGQGFVPAHSPYACPSLAAHADCQRLRYDVGNRHARRSDCPVGR